MPESMRPDDWFSVVTKEYLQDFVKNRGQDKVFLVMDRHPAHKAKIVGNYVASLKGQLTLYELPAYAPDLNPDEFAWSHMKVNGVSKKPLKKNESLRERVEQDLRDIQQNPELVRSFFMAESVVYAKDLSVIVRFERRCHSFWIVEYFRQCREYWCHTGAAG